MEHLFVTPEDCVHVLENCFKNQKLEYQSFELIPLSEGISGFLGDHFNFKIKFKINDQVQEKVFFLKTKPVLKKTVEDLLIMAVYKKETFMYTFLFKEYENLGLDVNFAPRYYQGKEEFLVLENMAIGGYKTCDPKAFFDVRETKSALKALAKFHACSIIYEREKSKQLGRKYLIKTEYPLFFNQKTFFSKEGSPGKKYFDSTLACLKLMIQKLPESEEWKNSCTNIFEKFNMGDLYSSDVDKIQCLCHSDLWSNNIMFRENSEQDFDCILLDFQLFSYLHPLTDVLLLIYANTRPAVYKKYLDEFLRCYYQNLERHLTKYDIKVNEFLPWEKIQEDSKYFTKFAMNHAITYHTFTLINPDVVTKSIDSKNEDQKFILFEDRPSFALKAFETDESYRAILTEDIYEFRNILLNS